MPGLFSENHVVSLGKTAVSDTTSETTTAVEDMSGFDEITFLVNLGDVDTAAVLTFTVKENTASSTSSPTPTAVTDGAVSITEDSANLDNKTIIINVKGSKLTKQYVFLSITAADESYEVVSINTIKSGARDLPVSQSSDVFSTMVQAGA